MVWRRLLLGAGTMSLFTRAGFERPDSGSCVGWDGFGERSLDSSRQCLRMRIFRRDLRLPLRPRHLGELSLELFAHEVFRKAPWAANAHYMCLRARYLKGLTGRALISLTRVIFERPGGMSAHCQCLCARCSRRPAAACRMLSICARGFREARCRLLFAWDHARA